MARPAKIVQLKLEKQALGLRNAGKTLDEAADALNATLSRREGGETVTAKAVQRYWASLDQESIVPAHRPQVAARNADMGMNLGGDIHDLHDKLKAWLEQAEDAKSYVYDKDGVLVGEDIDWRARTSVAREFRETLKFTAEMLERIYNVEQIKVFQQTVLETIAEASPELQGEIKRRFEVNQQIVRAKLLGL